MLNIYETFFRLKHYETEFPCTVLHTSNYIDKAVEKMKKAYSADYVTISTEPQQSAHEMVVKVCRERYIQKKKRESLCFKIKENRPYINSAFFICFFSFMILAIFVAPGIGKHVVDCTYRM